MRVALVLMTFSIVVLGVSIVSADWFHDFDGIAADPVTTLVFPDSDTLQTDWAYTIDGTNKMFRGWETRTSGEGGTVGVGVLNSEQIIDVRISATINPALNTDDTLGVAGRNEEFGKLYYAGVNFTNGSFWILKVRGLGDYVFLQESEERLEDLARSYYLEMDIVGTDEPQITARLFDERGGSLLRSLTGVDTGADGTPVYRFGQSATWSNAETGVLDVSFDDVSAITIPEPSAALLAGLGLLGLAVWRRKKQSVAHAVW